MQNGDMVRGDGRLMRILESHHDSCRCVWVDTHGIIQTKWFDEDEIMPFEMAVSPRSVWPDANTNVLEIEREERETEADKRSILKAIQRHKRKIIRKSVRSNRIKRGVAA